MSAHLRYLMTLSYFLGMLGCSSTPTANSATNGDETADSIATDDGAGEWVRESASGPGATVPIAAADVDGANGASDTDPPAGSAGMADTATAGTGGAADGNGLDGASPAASPAASNETEPSPSSPNSDLADMPATTPPPSRWSMGETMLTPRSELAVTLLDGVAYVAGGYGGFAGATATFEAYDIEADSWGALQDMPVAMEHPCMAALDGKVYLSCGQRSATAGPSELFVYDPNADTWSQLADMPTARWGATAVAYNGALYIIGGTEPGGMTIQRYDPSTDTWMAQAELDMLRDHAVAVVHGDLIYVLGGRPGRGEVYDTSVIFDPAANTISPGPKMDQARSGFAAASVGPYICAAGGEILVDPYHALDTGSCLDPATGIWSATDTLPGPIHGIGAIGYDGNMLIFGGAGMPARATPLAGGVYILTP